MWTKHFMIAAVLGVAGLFLGTNLAHAQGYSHLYGYYYPDRQEFVTFYEGTANFQEGVTPQEFEAFTGQRLPSEAAPMTAYYYQPVPAAADTASIEVVVPDLQAHVWFDGTSTTTVGTDRFYQTPTLAAGSTYSYRLKASWIEGGHKVTRERTISVTSGQTTVVDLAH
jgi:uncharacterized protein (TIGR03000 family)